jgi:phenylalanyl-tRNA synthetase alpha chain
MAYHNQMVQSQIINTTTSVLTPEGIEIATNGSHEARVWAALPLKGQGEPMTIPELQVSLPAR